MIMRFFNGHLVLFTVLMILLLLTWLYHLDYLASYILKTKYLENIDYERLPKSGNGILDLYCFISEGNTMATLFILHNDHYTEQETYYPEVAVSAIR